MKPTKIWLMQPNSLHATKLVWLEQPNCLVDEQPKFWLPFPFIWSSYRWCNNCSYIL